MILVTSYQQLYKTIMLLALVLRFLRKKICKSKAPKTMNNKTDKVHIEMVTNSIGVSDNAVRGAPITDMME
jgi:hypothetical protein